MTTHLPVLRLLTPSNATYFLNYLIEVATFDPIPIEVIWSVFTFPEKHPFDAAFEASGYSYIYALENFGTGTVLIHVFVFAMLISGLLWKIDTGNRVYTCLFKLAQTLYFGPLLMIFYEGYLEMSISTFISWYNLEWSPELGKSVLYCNIFTYTMILVLITFPFFILIFYSRRADSLHEERFTRRYGAIYEGLKVEDKKDKLTNRTVTMLFPFFFVLRRLIFCAAALYLGRYPALQLLILYFVTTGMVIFLMRL